MNTTHNTRTKLLAKAVGVAAAAVATSALLFAGAGTAQADECPYDAGYLDGKTGGIGQCFQDPSQQAQYDAGFADAQAGRQPNPMGPDVVIPPMITNARGAAELADPPIGNPDAPAPATMGPRDGTMGSGLPDPPEWPEYDLPPEPYSPEPIVGD
jgi:hypothetical protein